MTPADEKEAERRLMRVQAAGLAAYLTASAAVWPEFEPDAIAARAFAALAENTRCPKS